MTDAPSQSASATDAPAAGHGSSPPRPAPWWARLNLWRALTFAGFALTFALGWTMLAPRTERPDERIVVVLGSEDARPALVASVDRSGRNMTVRVLGEVVPTPGHVLELWMLPEGREPRSLGIVPPSGLARIPLGAPAGILFQRIPKLAVSLEPVAGAPHERPTGVLLFTGVVQQLY